jgi:hypothetical protein
MKGKEILGKIKTARWYILAFLFFIAMIVIWIASRTKTMEPPEVIGKLHRMDLIAEDSARSTVADLHGYENVPNDNFVANYLSPDGSGQLTESFYGNNKTAVEELNRIAERFQSGMKPTPGRFRKIEMEKIPVILSFEAGKANFCFVFRNGLYWFTVDEPIGASSMRDFARYLRKH